MLKKNRSDFDESAKIKTGFHRLFKKEEKNPQKQINDNHVSALFFVKSA